jgi:ribose transport system substrate-binding protein
MVESAATGPTVPHREEGGSLMSTTPNTPEGTDGASPRRYTRGQALGRLASITAGVAAGPTVFGAFASEALAAGHAATGYPTKFKQFKPFNPHVPAGPPTGLPKTIATNIAAGSAYFIELSKTVQKSVESRGYSLTTTTYASDVAKNVDQLTQLLKKGVGGIVLQAQDEHAEKAVLTQAIKQGVCVIYEVASPCTQQIAADQYKCGYTQGLVAVKWIKENLGGNANVVVFNAAKIAQTLIPRTTGRIAALKTGGPGIKVVANLGISLLTPEEGSKAASTLMQAHPDINVWIGDDDTIVGVESTLMAMGKKPSDKIYLSGFNGQANALARLQAGGLFRADVAFPNGVYEWATGQYLCDYIEGKSIPQVQVLDPVPITKENIGKFLADDKNPKAAFDRGVQGYLTLLGNIDYRTRMKNYIRASIS